MESNHHQLTTTETSHQGQQPATTMQYRLIDLLTQYPDKWKPVSSLQTFLKEQFFKIYGKNIDSMHFLNILHTHLVYFLNLLLKAEIG